MDYDYTETRPDCPVHKTPCPCPRGPDDKEQWCSRHGCWKLPQFRWLCRNRLGYWDLFEQEKVPQLCGLYKKRRIPLAGTALAATIKFVTFGKVKPCLRCKSRAAAMNRYDLSWRRWWKEQWAAAAAIVNGNRQR